MNDHRRAALLFLAYWLALWVLDWSLGWNRGIPAAGMLLLFSAPVLAGGLVAWWRESARYRGGALAAALVTVGSVTFAFIPDALESLNGGGVSVKEWLLEGVGSWLGASVVFGVFGGLLGLLGALMGATLWRATHPNVDR
jgi:hypothetical protein